MILQSLAQYYEALAAKGELQEPGWSPAKVAWGIELNDDGALMSVVPLETPVQRGGKQVMTPQTMYVPSPEKRTVGIAPNFLCDNASYLLGIDNKGKPERTIKCFEACRDRHEKLLNGVDDPFARAILAFFHCWEPLKAREHPALRDRLEEVLTGGNIVFFLQGAPAHERPRLRQAWDERREDEGGAVTMPCLVTGKVAPVAILHPSIKNVQGAQSTGASLVSFNARALESYGREDAQGLNAPVSEHAAFAYTAALNYLTAARDHHMRLGDATVVFWAEGAEDAYAALFGGAMNGGTVADQDIAGVLNALANGKNAVWNNVPVSPENRFYVLGLAPNASRLSVRFFLMNSFGWFVKNIQEHQKRLEIARHAYDKQGELSVWALLNETVNQNAREKMPMQQMAGDVTRAVLQNGLYPATLFNQVQLRIRAEHDVSRGKAAIIKAYLLRNIVQTQENHPYREVISVKLNERTSYAPYLLGRLFSVLEGLQQNAIPGINATIRDRYFSSACATPAMVFPTLLRLAQAHLKKLEGGKRVYYDRQLTELLGRMDEPYPTRLSLYDQGIFQLGYYHQTQKRFMKKEDQ